MYERSKLNLAQLLRLQTTFLYTTSILYTCVHFTHVRTYVKIKRDSGGKKSAHEPKAQTAGAYTGFLSIKHVQEYCYHSPGRDASPLQGYPPPPPPSQQFIAGTQLYTWVKRDKVE